MHNISPVEDLMREHGVLHRLLLIYKNIIYRIEIGSVYNTAEIYGLAWRAARIVKRFIEEYHQALERDYIFPVLKQCRQYDELIETLLKQHNAADCVTDKIMSNLQYKRRSRFVNRHLSRLIAEYILMYEPHSAREDTVIFPTFHQLVPEEEFDRLGKEFENIEERKFGKNGFEKIIGEISQIEKSLNIYDLSRFTIECEKHLKTADNIKIAANTYYWGMDIVQYPGDEIMKVWKNSSPLQFTGFYLAPTQNQQNTSWMDKKTILAEQGWGFAPIYMGLQTGSDNLTAEQGLCKMK